jgi:hypothetical protein
MKTSKILIALALGVSTLTGCMTGRQPFSYDDARSLTTVIIKEAVQIELTSSPSHRIYYVQALLGVNDLVKAQNWSITALASALDATGNKTFNSTNGQLFTDAATLLDISTGHMVTLTQPEWAKPVIEGVQSGLTQALNQGDKL